MIEHVFSLKIFSLRLINNVETKIFAHYYQLTLITTEFFSLIINDGHWHCFCKEVSGCCRENLVRDWCLICILKLE